MKIVILALLLCSISTILYAQIPNAGFENWIDEFTPQDWNNLNASESHPISRTSSAYTGSYAIKLEATEYMGKTVLPGIYMSYPANKNYGRISGYYQFYPANDQDILNISATTYDGKFGNDGSIKIQAAAPTYMPFSFDIENDLSGASGYLFIKIDIRNSSYTPGAYALIDQLSFDQATSAESINNQLPSEYSLEQNYPNPFNPSTTIEFSIPQESFVELKVFDVLGKEVATLVSDNYSAGNYKTNFGAKDLPSGMYIARISAGEYVQTRKMLLLK